MMIGGDDIILSTYNLGKISSLEICISIFSFFWKNCIFQSGTTAKIYKNISEISLKDETEIFVFNKNEMIHILAYKNNQITIVVDNSRELKTKFFIWLIKINLFLNFIWKSFLNRINKICR